MKNFLKALIATALVYSVAVPAFGREQDTIFDIRPNERAWLRYAYFVNEFDNSTVRFWIGEIKLLHSTGSKELLSIVPTLDTDGKGIQQEQEQQGEATALLAHSRTKPFKIQEGDFIDVYRELELLNGPCDKSNPTGDGTGGGRPGGWDVTDRTEFVVQIRRESDNLILATIDSVGVNPGTGEQRPLKYGIDPLSRWRKIPVSGIVPGTEVYIQVSPRRYGTTPYGISMNHYQGRVPATWAMDINGNLAWQPGESDALYQKRFEQIMAYCEQSVAATGQLPPYQYQFRKVEHRQAFYNRFFDEHSTGSGQKYYTPKYIIYAKKADISPDKATVAFLEVSPNPAENGNSVKMRLNAKEEGFGKLMLSTVEGRFIARLWEGRFTTGDFEISVNIENYASGTYFLSLQNEKSQVITTHRFTISK